MGIPRVGATVKEQMDRVSFMSPFMVSAVRAEVGETLARVTPPGLAKAFFTLAGADANEVAMRTARLVTGRRKILTRYRSYHGGSHAVLAASGDPRRKPVEGGMGDIVRIPDPYHYRFPWIASESEFRDFNLAQIEEIIQLEDPATVAAVMVEPVTGSNGLIIPPAGLARRAAGAVRPLRHPPHLRRGDVRVRPDRALVRLRPRGRVARHHDDRQGHHERVHPARRVHGVADIAAAVDGIPIGAGLTYQSHPVGLAAARAVLGIYESDGLIERAAEMGEVLRAGLLGLQERHPSVGDVRSIGLFSTLELVHDRTTHAELMPLRGPASPVAAEMSAD